VHAKGAVCEEALRQKNSHSSEELKKANVAGQSKTRGQQHELRLTERGRTTH
jgi:hypothetical protein